MASNIYVPGGLGITTNGFAMGKLGYGNPSGPGITADGYFYGPLAPFIALQGGTESNAGVSYIGKVNSQDFGAQIGATVAKNFALTAG